MADNPREQAASPESSDSSKTLKQLFEDAVHNIDKNPDANEEERALLVQMETAYEMDRLKVTLDTRQEVLEFMDEVESLVADSEFSDEDIVRLEETIVEVERREGVEDHINELENVETVADLRELSVDQLIELEDKHEGILLYAFTDFVGDDAAIDMASFESFYKNPVIGQKITVNFRGNTEAESMIGVGDIFPPSVRRITIYEGGNEAFKTTSKHRIGLKGQNKTGNGFFSDEGYIAVYSTDVVLIGGEETEGIEAKDRVDVELDRKYRKEAPEGELGELDYAKYEAEMAAADTAFMDTLPEGARTGKYHSGSSLSRKQRRQMDIQGDLGGRNIERILEKTPSLYLYAHKAREHYAEKTGIDIDESIMFGVINIES
ncbi:MAG: hypothetical protein Q8P27_00750, partial [Candidatus Peregrinibacteria bacterium]|nr:hypothetical protein [Candidatus Peregrinibacteria bacterium]